MPMIYSISLATAGNLTTSGTPNTETDTFFIKSGTGRTCGLQAVYVIGKAAALTSISGLSFRVIRLATASTSGTGMTGAPKDTGMQAAKFTAASRPTIGSTRTNRVVFGCGAAGPGGWVAPNPDSVEVNDTTAGSIDLVDSSGTASLNFEFSAEVVE